LVKICVIDNGDKTEIIVLGHHIIGDGIGYLNLAKDILLALDNKLDVTPEITPIKNLGKGNSLLLLSRLYVYKLNSIWRKNRISFSEKDYCEFFEQYRKKYIPKKYFNSVDEAGLKRIIEKCKKNNFTVNELILSAFSNALIEVTDKYLDKKIRIGVVANIRNELETKPNNCMGNYITGVSVKVKYKPENSFLKNTKNVSRILRRQLRSYRKRFLAINFLSAIDGDLLETIAYAAYGNHLLPISKEIGNLIGEGKGKKRLGISNLGQHEFSGYDSVKLLDMQFISPTFAANILSVSIITVNNKLNVCLLYNEIEIKDDTAEKIYKKAIDLLLE